MYVIISDTLFLGSEYIDSIESILNPFSSDWKNIKSARLSLCVCFNVQAAAIKGDQLLIKMSIVLFDTVAIYVVWSGNDSNKISPIISVAFISSYFLLILIVLLAKNGLDTALSLYVSTFWLADTLLPIL